MRCFALLSICLMCALNDSNESKVSPRNLALLCIGMFVLLMVMCVVGFFLGGATFTRIKYLCRLVGI